MTNIAAIQMNSSTDVNTNLEEAQEWLEEAADQGASLAVLPEDFALLAKNEEQRLSIAEEYGHGAIQSFLEQQAKELGMWIIAGTLPLKCDDPSKIRSATLVYDDTGKVQARYDKIHLFDVRVADKKGSYQESKSTQAGQDIVVIETPCGRVGLSVCYDLRFPEMFRRMQREGLDVIVLPAAFTKVTGQAHWETLLRARAIENLAYVVASAQWGEHDNGRETYGHSMIINPWGEIIERFPAETGVIVANIDTGLVKSTREKFPAIEHIQLI